MLTWWKVIVLVWIGGLLGIWFTRETDRLAQLPEDEKRRLVRANRYTLGILLGLAITYWGTGWLPWLAALDTPVRIAGTMLNIFCTIQLWRAYRRTRAVLRRER